MSELMVRYIDANGYGQKHSQYIGKIMARQQ